MAGERGYFLFSAAKPFFSLVAPKVDTKLAAEEGSKFLDSFRLEGEDEVPILSRNADFFAGTTWTRKCKGCEAAPWVRLRAGGRLLVSENGTDYRLGPARASWRLEGTKLVLAWTEGRDSEFFAIGRSDDRLVGKRPDGVEVVLERTAR